MPIKNIALACIMFLATTMGASAQSGEDVVLTVTGVAEAPLEFDRAALQALEVETFATSTIWTDGEITFTGVPLRALLAELGVEDGVLLASAINDYTIEFPVSDALANGPIIAYLMNGQPMSVRDKGPLWIVYPYDSDPGFQSEVVYSRSIWQLDRIEVSR